MKRLIPVLLILAAGCGLAIQPPQTPAPVPTAPPGSEAPSSIAILTVEVVGPEPVRAFVQVGDREWVTRPDRTIVEEFSAGDVLEVAARADGYVPSAPQRITMTPGQMPRLVIELAKVPAPPAVPDLRINGRNFRTADGVLWIPRCVSHLTALVRAPEQQEAFLSWAADTGFNCTRVFAGALTWAGQTPEGARAALTPYLDRAAAHGLVVEVTALTDTGTGYDARAHLAGVVERLAGRRGVLLELANEVGHHTQAEDMTPARLRAWGMEIVEPRGIPWAIGAPVDIDEPCPPDPWIDEAGRVLDRPSACAGYGRDEFPGQGGWYVTVHLDRGRESWNQLRRVREIAAVAASLRVPVPVINNEPIGCAEPGTPGQRYYDPAWAATLGALDRAFGVGGVHHSQAGLMAELPGPIQRQCAAAYIAAFRAVDQALAGEVGEYKNVGHGGSPLVGARFVEGGQADGVVRAYSFIRGDRGVTVLVGAKGQLGIQWKEGWRFVREVIQMTAEDGRSVAVWEISR